MLFLTVYISSDSMIKTIKKLFGCQTNQTKTKKIENINNTISFVVDKESNISIKLLFEDNSLEAAKDMGIFLYELNSGLLTQSIIDLMTNLGNDNKEYEQFVASSILCCLKEYSKNKENTQKDRPIISPSKFMDNTTYSDK